MRDEINYKAEAAVVRDEVEKYATMYRQCETVPLKAYARDMINHLNKIATRLEHKYEGI